MYRFPQLFLATSTSGNLRPSIAFTRISESLIATLGANVGESKDSFGVSCLVAPRFLPTLSVTRRIQQFGTCFRFVHVNSTGG